MIFRCGDLIGKTPRFRFLRHDRYQGRRIENHSVSVRADPEDFFDFLLGDTFPANLRRNEGPHVLFEIGNQIAFFPFAGLNLKLNPPLLKRLADRLSLRLMSQFGDFCREPFDLGVFDI